MDAKTARRIFNDCARHVERLLAIETHLGAVNLEPTNGGQPTNGNHCAEYIADFHNTGKDMLPRKQRQLFELHYIGRVAYEAVAEALRIDKHTANDWHRDMKRVVGPELQRRGLWPISDYRKPSEQLEQLRRDLED